MLLVVLQIGERNVNRFEPQAVVAGQAWPEKPLSQAEIDKYMTVFCSQCTWLRETSVRTHFRCARARVFPESGLILGNYRYCGEYESGPW